MPGEKKSSAVPWLVLVIVVLLVIINGIWAHWAVQPKPEPELNPKLVNITRDQYSICVKAFNSVGKLPDKLEGITFIEDTKYRTTLDEAKDEIKELMAELDNTNAQYNKLELLVGCLMDQH